MGEWGNEYSHRDGVGGRGCNLALPVIGKETTGPINVTLYIKLYFRNNKKSNSGSQMESFLPTIGNQASTSPRNVIFKQSI